MTDLGDHASVVAGARTWLFDCDGVLLDVNGAKTEAFRALAAPYGPEAADALVDHHRAHGGVTRQAKVDHLFTVILGRAPEPGERERLLDEFAATVREALHTATLDPTAVELLTRLRAQGCRTFVVSGGAEVEVRSALSARGVARLFDGIYGNPATKHEIVERLVASSSLTPPALVVGDGSLDARLAVDFGMAFCFVAHWSEWPDARDELPAGAVVVEDLAELAEVAGVGA